MKCCMFCRVINVEINQGIVKFVNILTSHSRIWSNYVRDTGTYWSNEGLNNVYEGIR